jgi:hypothetical protein
MRKVTIIAIASVLSACSETSMNGPHAMSKVPANAPCMAPLAEYCAGGRCPTFDEAVARRAAYCARPGQQSLQSRQCAGLYRTVSWRDNVLGGGDEYFDDSGRFAAASLVSDYGSQYCGRSFTQTFGELPLCPGEITVTSLCR